MEFLRLIVSIILCQFAGFVGSIATRKAIPVWYAYLNKPSLTPPNWLFGPVWITLYFLMGISAFLVWKKVRFDTRVKTAMGLFFVQLFLNALWSLLFFGLRSPLAGLIDITILWALILLTIILFLRISKTAGFLLIPYILWVSFAIYLNFSIWILN